MMEETRRIVRAFLDARTPVVVHVAPAAARAGSAGAFVTMAAHVAAMAPGTSIGAAHPVLGPSGADPDQAGEEMARKVENDVASLARAVAGRRARNVEWAENAVRESASATATEAESLGVIDLVIGSEEALLAAIDGRTVELASGEEIALTTAGVPVIDHPMTVQEWTLTRLGDPSLAYALLTLGMLALVLELFTPGIGVAGAIGAILMVLGAVGLHLLPVDVGAVVLLVAALGLFAAELYVTSYGLLALAGVACLVIGGALLIDRSDPELFADAGVSVSWGVMLPLAVLLGGAAIALGVQVGRARKRPSPTGAEGLLGESGEALSDVDPRGGAVWLHGERWQAVSDEPLPARTPVRVRDVRGLVLRVVRAREPQGGAS
jgi:membrane-bound serine protease (ClpP class)